MIIVYIVSDNGNGYTHNMKFESLEDVRLYTANIGRDCLITIEEDNEKEDKN